MMEEGNSRDALMLALEELGGGDHTPARALQIRNRAVALLAQRRRRSQLWAGLLGNYSRVVEPALVGVFSLGFVAWTVARSIEILHLARGGFFWP